MRMSRIAIVLGSQCESVSERIDVQEVLPYSQIDGYPEIEQTVSGHAFEVLMGTLDGVSVYCYNGRAHRYQGLSAYEVSAMVRHAYHHGCDTLLLVIGVATLAEDLEVGETLIATDHINYTDDSPLVGPTPLFPDDVPFVDMCDAYDPGLRELAKRVADEQGIALREGAMVCIVGPQFLTPLEVRMFNSLGCKVVTLSMAAEVIQARALGMRVLAIAPVTSRAGVRVQRKTYDEMMGEPPQVLGDLVAGIVRELGAGA